MRIPLAALLIFVALTQPGFTCGPTIPPPGVTCEAGEAPSTRGIEVGQYGLSMFTPLNEDQRYAVEYGIQGGQHTFVAVRFFGEPGELEWMHDVRLYDDDGQQVGGRVAIEEACEGWTVVDNIQVFVDDPDLEAARIAVESGPVDSMYGTLITSFTTSGRIRFE